MGDLGDAGVDSRSLTISSQRNGYVVGWLPDGGTYGGAVISRSAVRARRYGPVGLARQPPDPSHLDTAPAPAGSSKQRIGSRTIEHNAGELARVLLLDESGRIRGYQIMPVLDDVRAPCW